MNQIKNYNWQKALSYADHYALLANPLIELMTENRNQKYIKACLMAGYNQLSVNEYEKWEPNNDYRTFPLDNKELYEVVPLKDASLGDILVLNNAISGHTYYVIVTMIGTSHTKNQIYVNSNDPDNLRRPLNTYPHTSITCYHPL